MGIWGTHPRGSCTQSWASPSGQAAREQTGPWSPRYCKAHRCTCQEPPLWPPQFEWSHPPSGSNLGSVRVHRRTASHGQQPDTQSQTHQARPGLGHLRQLTWAQTQAEHWRPLGRGCLRALPDHRPSWEAALCFPSVFGGNWRGPDREPDPQSQHLSVRRVGLLGPHKHLSSTFSTCRGRPSLFHLTTVAGGSASTGQRM